jgi:hypothetical protein
MVTRPVVNGVVTAAGVGADDVSGGGAASFSEMFTLYYEALTLFQVGTNSIILLHKHVYFNTQFRICHLVPMFVTVIICPTTVTPKIMCWNNESERNLAN